MVSLGVNNHNQTIVFGATLVSNETKDTYIWLLEKFFDAMEQQVTSSIIIDGDIAMRNAMRKVFPNVHHRMCASHLLRNTTSNVKNLDFCHI